MDYYGERSVQPAWRRRGRDYAESIVSELPMAKKTSSHLDSILTWTGLTTLLHMGTSIALLIIFLVNGTVSQDYYNLYFTADSKAGVEWISAGNWAVAPALAAANGIYALGGIASILGWNWFILPGLAKGVNSARNVADCLAFPIISSTILMALGDFNLMALMMNFSLVHAMYVVGGYLNDWITATKGAGYTVSNYSIWLFILNLIPTIIYLAWTQDIGSMDSYIWGAMGLQWAYWLISGWAIRMYVSYKKNGHSSLFDGAKSAQQNQAAYESMSITTTTLFVMAITWLLFAASFTAPTYIETVDALASNAWISQSGVSYDHTPYFYNQTRYSFNGSTVLYGPCIFTGTGVSAVPCWFSTNVIAPR